MGAPWLVDPEGMVLGVALEDDHLGPFVLVIREREFARLAIRSTARGKPVVAAQVSFVTGRPSRWSPFVFPKGKLAAALLAGIKPTFKVSPPPRVRGATARATGFSGAREGPARLPAAADPTT